MPIKVDTQEVFGSGPGEIIPGPLMEPHADYVFPGLAGVRRMLLGGAVRALSQSGELRATAATANAAVAAVQTMADTIEALSVGTHTLLDQFGVSYQGVALLPGSLRFAARPQVVPAGEQYMCIWRYACEWTVLTPPLPGAS